MYKIMIALLGLMLAWEASAQPPDTGNATTFVVKFKIKAGKNAEFEKAFAEMSRGVHAREPGNVYYELYQPPKDPQTYVVLEHYKTPQDVAAHGKTEHAARLMGALKELVDGPPSAESLVLVKLH